MSKKPEFFEIKDSAMNGKILNALVRHKIPVTLWLKNQSIKFESTALHRFESAKKISMDFPSSFTEKEFLDAISSQKSDEIFGSFQLDSVNFFFKTKFLNVTENIFLMLAIPPSIFKMQRRNALRIPFLRNTAPTLSLLDPSKPFNPDKPILEKDIVSVRVIDISAGGVAVAVPMEYEKIFTKGTLLRDVRFKLRGSDIVAEGQVVHSVETINEVGRPILRIGIQFRALKSQYEKLIVQFVLDESRKIFTQLI